MMPLSIVGASRWWSIGVSVLALVVLAAALAAALSWSGALLEVHTSEAGSPACVAAEALHERELVARMMLTWGLTLGLTAIALVLFYCLWAAYSKARRRATVPAVFGAAVLLGVFAAWLAFNPDGYFFGAYAHHFECAKGFAGVTGEFPLVAAANSLFVFASFVLAGSVWQSSLDLPADVDRETDLTQIKDLLCDANDEVVRHLYLGSALLVSSIVGLHSFYRWPVALVGDGGALGDLGFMITVLYGSIYTLVLAFVLGPALVAVHVQGLRVARDTFDMQTSLDATSWLADSGLRASGLQRGARVLATLAPLLAGPVLDLLNLAG